MYELEPCPFCESENVAVQRQSDSFDYRVMCFDCTGTGPVGYLKEQAIQEWNRRKSRWISAEERLPTNPRPVPVVFDNGHSMIAAYAAPHWHFVTTEVLLGPIISRSVAYWYDVPEPPEISNDRPQT